MIKEATAGFQDRVLTDESAKSKHIDSSALAHVRVQIGATQVMS